jgi:iron complex outermembrane receptor protein
MAEELKLRKNGLYLSFLMQDFGKMYVDDNNSASTSNYALFDLGIGHDGIAIGKDNFLKLAISGGISNIFNTKYVTSVTINAAAGRYYEPGPGRTVFVNLRIESGRRSLLR